MSRTSASLLERLKGTDNQDACGSSLSYICPDLSLALQAGLRENEASDLVQEVFLVLLEKLRSSNTTTSAVFGVAET